VGAEFAVVQTCSKCRRSNPREANYCYFDGIVLDHRGGDIPADGSAMNLGTRPFTVPLVFPSGLACHNFQQLAEACHDDPSAAVKLLRKGYLESFLGGQGRADLAMFAHAAAKAPDLERGLDDLLGRMPFVLPSARLRAEPSVIDAGTVRIGEDAVYEIEVRNEGMRLLYGSAACAAPWVALGDGAPQPAKMFQCTDRIVLQVRIVGSRLRAFDKPQEAQIVLDSNGGSRSITVRVLVAVKPFPDSVLGGALSPRQLAKKAQHAPKEAAALIENGAVAQWYRDNGWTYPVPEPWATGLASVQQLFEALGLVKPPPVELSENAIRLGWRPGDQLEHTLAVITQENRSAIASASSDQPWLHVGKAIFRGRSAFLPLTIAGVLGRTGETMRAILTVTANGGQQFAVPVTVTIGASTSAMPAPVAVPVPSASRPAMPATPPPSPPKPVPVPTAVPVRPGRVMAPSAPTNKSGGRMLLLMPALVLIGIALAAALRDYLMPARAPSAPPQPQATVVDSVPQIEIRFHDEKQSDELEKLWMSDQHPTMRFGVITLRNGQLPPAGTFERRLTFDPWGRTNNTCLRFDGKDERLFGGSGGSWDERAARQWKDDKGVDHEGMRSVWVSDDWKLHVTQLVERVRGEQSQLLDTCRVRYQMQNHDDRAHTVGIRFLLDTFIGGNDGVPFTIPGDSDLCDTSRDLPAQARDHKIPDFLQALEKPDLAHPGTIAHLRLKLDGLEAPMRVTLGAWPDEKLRVLDRGAAGPATLWTVPLLPLKSIEPGDSAVTIYWEEKPLMAQAQREVGFEYGLWNLATQGSRLAATVDGAFRPEGELTVIAYLSRSGQAPAEETVTLKVPEGFKLLEGDSTQQVPKLANDAKAGNVPITWRMQAGPTGRYELVVTTSSGLAQTLRVEIRKSIY
jgi:hypothetical protein